MKLKFFGAAGTVTGSKTILEIDGKKWLIDAGLFQGPKDQRILNWEVSSELTNVDGIFLTHAHIDHSGILPKLYREGYRGPIYCTQGTLDLCQVMLRDSAHLQEEDAEFANLSKHSHHKPALPLYTTEDAINVLQQFEVVSRDEWFPIDELISVRFLRSGHIVGSSFVQFQCSTQAGPQTITFSGDLGNGRSHILRPPVTVNETDFLVLESTYGDRLQPRVPVELEMELYLKRILNRKGVAVIPAFTVGRTQELLFLINKLMDQNKIPKVSVYVDSPMASSANEIFLKNVEDHILMVENGKIVTPICPQDYHETKSVQDSRDLVEKKGPFIVISASGMVTGGRILHHLKARLPHPENGILFVGYQAHETKGRLLLDGIKSLRIHHEEIPVNAEIFNIEGLSAHADYLDTLEWLSHLKRAPKLIILNHGEHAALRNLKALIESQFNYKVTIAQYLESFDFAELCSQD